MSRDGWSVDVSSECKAEAINKLAPPKLASLLILYGHTHQSRSMYTQNPIFDNTRYCSLVHDTYKARVVGKEYSQVEGVDYDQPYGEVRDHSTNIRFGRCKGYWRASDGCDYNLRLCSTRGEGVYGSGSTKMRYYQGMNGK